MPPITLKKGLVFLPFLLVLSLLTFNCHTQKNNDSGNLEASSNDSNSDNKDKELKDTHMNSNHKLGEVIQVTNGDYVGIGSEHLRIKIETVAESRCPLNVQCVQIGKAKTKLNVIKEDMVFFVELTAKGGCQKTDGSCGDSQTMNGYKFTLMHLSPYPGNDGLGTSVQQDAYVAHIRIERDR